MVMIRREIDLILFPLDFFPSSFFRFPGSMNLIYSVISKDCFSPFNDEPIRISTRGAFCQCVWVEMGKKSSIKARVRELESCVSSIFFERMKLYVCTVNVLRYVCCWRKFSSGLSSQEFASLFIFSLASFPSFLSHFFSVLQVTHER